MSYEFVGDLHGMPATAVVEFEPLHSYTLMSGQVRSPNAHYVFTADIYGDGGYGDMADRTGGGQFRIQIHRLSEAGFLLTANPFEGTSSTTYAFRRTR